MVRLLIRGFRVLVVYLVNLVLVVSQAIRVQGLRVSQALVVLVYQAGLEFQGLVDYRDYQGLVVHGVIQELPAIAA